MKVAVVGSGISGLSAARTLAKSGAKVVLYEKEDHLGGHAWTIHVNPELAVDVGFMVFNRVTYPHMIKFFEELGVEMELSDMSFSVSLKQGWGCEWGSNGLFGLFAQKRNLLNPFFLQMIREMLIFHTDVLNYLSKFESGNEPINPNETLGQFLKERKYSEKFMHSYLIPVCGSIWSCGTEKVLNFSAHSILSFLKNHHLLQLVGRPRWLTVKNRSETYVNKVIEELKSDGSEIIKSCEIKQIQTTDSGVLIIDESGNKSEFDECIIATHAPEALTLIDQGLTYDERRILGAFKYSSSQIYLHRDVSFMPKRKSAWSAWNFTGDVNGSVCVTYWLNILQNLNEKEKPIFVTLNPETEPNDVIRTWRTSHPIPSPAAVLASNQLKLIQGKRKLWFCGAYQGFGFHEDGFKAGMEAAMNLLGKSFQILPYEKQMVCSYMQFAAKYAVTSFLNDYIRIGCLQLVESGGPTLKFGEDLDLAKNNKLNCKLFIKNPDFYWKICTRSELGLADAYVDGDFVCYNDTDGLLSFLLIIIANKDNDKVHGQSTTKPKGWWSPALLTSTFSSFFYYFRHLLRNNNLTNARRNIANHYDLSNDLFQLFLDRTMTYSCAIFKQLDEPLEDSQLRKIHRLIKKAQIKPHHRVLEIGFGWGSMAIEMVKLTKCKYTGITLSTQQFEYAQKRVNEENLQEYIEFKLVDYRLLQETEKFDRIISCEMIEAVGHEYLGEFYKQCDRLLAKDGLLVVQVITMPEERYEEYRNSSDFIKEYIFPGGCCPSFAALISAMNSSSTLSVEHVENIGVHYATTLLRWRDNFNAKKDAILALGFSEKFFRMWQYYFIYCAVGFQTCILGNLQIVYSRQGNVESLGDVSASHYLSLGL